MPRQAGRGSLTLPDPRGLKQLTGCSGEASIVHHLATMGTTLSGWQRDPLAMRVSYTHTQDPATAAHYTAATPGLPGTAPESRRAQHVLHAPVCVCSARSGNRLPAGAQNRFAPAGSRSPAGSCVESGVPPHHRAPYHVASAGREVHTHWPGEGAGWE